MSVGIPRVCVKLFADEPDIPDGQFVEIFHGWIRDRTVDGILLDVADYAHVPEGPGIMLVTHAIAFSLDRSHGRFGLRAQQRRRAEIASTLHATLAFADLLERDSRVQGRLVFDRSSIEVESNDRLRAPNTAEGYAAFTPVVRDACDDVFPSAKITRLERPPRDRLAVSLQLGSADV